MSGIELISYFLILLVMWSVLQHVFLTVAMLNVYKCFIIYC